MAKPKKLEQGKRENSPFSEIKKRYNITAREARDIATAVGTLKDVVTNRNQTGAEGGIAKQVKKAVGNIGQQVKETGRAAATGKRGTTSGSYITASGDTPSYVKKGAQRGEVKKKTSKKSYASDVKFGSKDASSGQRNFYGDAGFFPKGTKKEKAYNQGYVSGKKDVAAMKRAAAKKKSK